MVTGPVPRSPGVLRLIVPLLILWLGLQGNVVAQSRPGGTSLLNTRPTQQANQRLMPENDLLALEGAIDPAAYVVGPGDQFSISIGGLVAINQLVPITAAGNLILPEAGAMPVAGRTLAEVQRDAEAALRTHFRNVSIAVNLIQPRQFYVHISGAVPEPGRYLMRPIARVDDVLREAYASLETERTMTSSSTTQYVPDQQAYTTRETQQFNPEGESLPNTIPSATSERPVLNKDFQPALRNVQVLHRDGSRETLDLIRYYNTGDTEENPYLRDGDVITVPSYHRQRDGIHVSGAVTYPGVFDFRPGDTLRDLLLLTASPETLGSLEEVRLTRRQPGGALQPQTFAVAEVLAGQAVPLMPGDHLNVMAQQHALVTLEGLVRFPGTYPIEAGKTTLREVVTLAGGLLPNADPATAYLERQDTQARKQDGRASDLDFFSRAYLARSNSINRVTANLQKALQEGGPEVVLYDADRIVFPRDEETVFVTGNVPRPGYMPFVAGQSAAYYIQQAGGQGALSKGVYVFEKGTGQMQTGEAAAVRSGDTVFVNRADLADTPEMQQLLISKRQARALSTQTIITGISALTGIVTTIIFIYNTLTPE